MSRRSSDMKGSTWQALTPALFIVAMVNGDFPSNVITFIYSFSSKVPRPLDYNYEVDY